MSAKDVPRVSLLIPIYNVERYLRQCLDSAIGQTLEDIEIICINDGSTDGSRDIIEEYAQKDSRIRVIDKENSGYGCSMNMGLEAAGGEYIGILESDDFFEPDALECLYRAARDAQVPVAKADFFLYWSQPCEKDEPFGWVDEDAPSVVEPIDYPEVFFRKPSIWSAIYSRDFLFSNGIRFLETPGASYQDTSFNYKVWACAENAALLRRCVLHYRQDNESSSVNSPGKAFCVCDEYCEMVHFTERIDDEEKRKALSRIVARMRFDAYLWNYERLSETLQLEFLEIMKQDFSRENRLGLYDSSLFDDGKRENRSLILEHSDIFHLRHSQYASRGKWNTLKRYYHAGGISYVLRACREYLSR